VLGRSGRAGAALGLLSFAFTLAGVALLQGGLVEIVRGLHADGDDEPAATELIGRASGKLVKLVCVSLLTALGVGFGLLPLPPGQRWQSVWQEQDDEVGASSKPSERAGNYWAE
jgi:hypothetical protein